MNPPTPERITHVALIVAFGFDAAEAGALPRRPAPIATIAQSAIRLKNVFVDIYFLSLVDLETISRSAWQRDKPFTS